MCNQCAKKIIASLLISQKGTEMSERLRKYYISISENKTQNWNLLISYVVV